MLEKLQLFEVVVTVSNQDCANFWFHSLPRKPGIPRNLPEEKVIIILVSTTDKQQIERHYCSKGGLQIEALTTPLREMKDSIGVETSLRPLILC